MKHLDKEDFLIFLEGGPIWQFRYIELHIEICPSCKEDLENFQKTLLK